MERSSRSPPSLTIHLNCAVDETDRKGRDEPNSFLFGLALEGFLEEGVFLEPCGWLIIETHKLECLCVGGDRCVPGIRRAL